MYLKIYIIASFLIGASFSSFSQHIYSFEVESLNSKDPKEVLKDFSQHIEEYNKHSEDGVFYFESKIVYTEENFKEIASATGYVINAFNITSKKEDDQDNE